MDVKGEVLLQLFNKSNLRNGTKTFLEPIFFLFTIKFKKLGFSAPLRKFFVFFLISLYLLDITLFSTFVRS